MIAVRKKQDHYLTAFERFEGHCVSAEPAWLSSIRRAAIDRYTELGWPTPKHEDWRGTNLSSLAQTTFRLAEDDGRQVSHNQIKSHHFAANCSALLVFVNGHYAAQLSSATNLPEDVQVGSLAKALSADSPDLREHLTQHADFRNQAFTALNTAMIDDGAFIEVPSGRVVVAPIHLLYISTDARGDNFVTHPRNLILARANSQATIVESYVGLGQGSYFTNAVTELVVDENATLDHYTVQRESDAAFHIATRQIHQFRSSTVHSHTLSIGGGLVRNNVNAVLDGEGCNCTLNGLYLPLGTQHIDNHLRVDHASPHCQSWEYYKGVLGDRSRSVFTGRIVVHEGAQKTNAKQSNMNLLLSDEAAVDTKPQLEIFADDVKCTHGATIGQIDEDAIFYLRTRGISEQAARSLLIYAFAGESIGQICIPELRDQLLELLARRLPHGELLRIGRPYEYDRNYTEHVRTTDQRRET